MTELACEFHRENHAVLAGGEMSSGHRSSIKYSQLNGDDEPSTTDCLNATEFAEETTCANHTSLCPAPFATDLPSHRRLHPDS